LAIQIIRGVFCLDFSICWFRVLVCDSWSLPWLKKLVELQMMGQQIPQQLMYSTLLLKAFLDISSNKMSVTLMTPSLRVTVLSRFTILKRFYASNATCLGAGKWHHSIVFFTLI
jgi:hypothetical protein